ncbi:ABC transporter permease [Jiangella mangrovi]|uniref:Peptide/nickel transport system permease protein n=1 Tax=Jiangella mangrovi TaxID=1524084 RepID=A0A7W9GRU9_9ACTN|nr:ABC transporter permease [Jiangella mangrovi]MBB5788581.1 peptide/nickel transport system permease protein [Jiangella mangrovi]
MTAVMVPAERLPRRRRPIGLYLSVAGLTAIVLVAVFAPALAPHSPTAQSLENRLLPPVFLDGGSWTHPLGTDEVGRDLLSRIVYGARVSILVGVLAVAVRMVVGVTIGLVAGYYGGPVRTFFLRLGDIQMALPSLILALGIIAAIGPGFTNVVLVLGITGWILYARLVVSQVVLIRGLDYVNSAQLLGASNRRVIWRHVLPNVMPTVIVYASLDVGMMMYTEASLSFIGLGVQPPTPSWGGMTSSGQALLATHWWVSTLPGAALLVTLILINILGEQVRDRLDPKLKVR